MNPTVYMLRGVLAFILGLILVIWPGGTLQVILILFPIFAILDGISAIIIGKRTFKQGKWLSFIPMGIFEILIGILVLFWPGITIEAFMFLMAIWAFLLGMGELFVAFSDDDLKSVPRWCHAIGGILTIILGICILSYPIITTMVFLWLIGIFFIVYGIMVFIIGLAFTHKESSRLAKNN